MPNPLMNVIGVSNQASKSNIVEQFKSFKASFKGDPKAKINELLSSGKITQEQLNQATEMANLIRSLVKK